MTFEQEIARRRTFAIVAHPDAGKTTLTEKLLLFGGAIQVAGAVKSNKIKKTATSDFMEIERQRGISVTTSVMGFDYKGMKVNILDTPGHEDFAEDTYRTLTAVDSVIVVVDAAKGVETQTEKLVRVCRMRDTPIIVFINKCDRPGQDPYDLMDEIEKKLGLTLRPLSWPIGMGDTFQGVYNLYERKLNLFTESAKTTIGESVEVDLADDVLMQYIGERDCTTLRNDVELITGVYPDFEIDTYRSGQVCPVFFGSALNNFGVRELLDCFINVAPSPQPAHTEERDVTPTEAKFTGFVFKIHANIDPNHRNRVAFLRITSGTFERNKPYTHVRLGRDLRFSNPTAFMADKREVIDEAYPGDIIGLHDTGVFRIGDSLTEGEKLHFTGIPAFSPEIFRYVENVNPLKSKQFAKGLEQLIDEGVVQMFISEFNNRRIVGTVGALQLEVLQYRLEHEYGATCRYESASLHKACWLACDDDTVMEKFRQRKLQSLARDKHGTYVYLAQSAWDLNSTQELFPEVKFYFTSEMK